MAKGLGEHGGGVISTSTAVYPLSANIPDHVAQVSSVSSDGDNPLARIKIMGKGLSRVAAGDGRRMRDRVQVADEAEGLLEKNRVVRPKRDRVVGYRRWLSMLGWRGGMMVFWGFYRWIGEDISSISPLILWQRDVETEEQCRCGR